MSSATKTVTQRRGARPWFATFTLLDAGCAIDSRQLDRILALLATLWRRTFRRLR